MEKVVCLCGVFLGVVSLSGCVVSKGSREWREFHQREAVIYPVEKCSVAITPYPDESAKLADYTKIALLNNPELKAAFYQWKAALKKIPQATSLSDPQFTYSRYIEEVETRVGAQQNAFSVMQDFPFFGKREARGDQAVARANQFREKYEDKKLELIYEVTDAYYEYAYLGDSIRITHENETLLKHFEEVAQIKYKTGATKDTDLLKVQVELGKIANDLISLRDFKTPVMARLNAALNLPVDYNLPLPKDVSYREVQGLNRDITFAQFKKNSPELKMLQHEIEEAQSDVVLSKLNFFPDVSVGVTYIDTNKRHMAGLSDDGKDPVIAMFKINIPIWYNRLSASLEESKARKTAKKSMLEAKTNTLSTRIETTLYKLQDALRQVKLYRDALIPKAEQSLRAEETDYKSGRADFLNLIDSQRTLLAFNLTYFRARANAAQRFAELEMLLGGEMEDGHGL